MESRKCKKCDGGVVVSQGFEFEGRVFPTTRRSCTVCEGQGRLPEPDFVAILQAVTTAHGGEPRFRKSAPEAWKQSTRGLSNRRAYYVWRWTRFNGGADVTMPMAAMLFAGDDAWRPELDAFAAVLAKKVYGTDLAGAHRWMRALVGGERVEGLPPSAYEGGEVQDGNKPGFEKPELK